jgi:hypothetical protein
MATRLFRVKGRDHCDRNFSGTALLREPIEAWRQGRTNPVLMEEHGVRAAGGSRHLRLDHD